MEITFEKTTCIGRLRRMLSVDLRRMCLSPLFYIMVGISLCMPILILVMTTMMDGSVTVDPQTGVETVIEGFDHVFQIIGSLSSSGSDGGMSMDLVSMCNIDLLYFGLAAWVCLFIAEDFRCGYGKNLFTVRVGRGEYLLSKILVCTMGGMAFVLSFLLGAVIGGGIAGLPFEMEGFGAGNLVCCILAKCFLVGVFVSIDTLMAIIAKERSWLSVVLSLCVGMLLFAMVPAITPLDAGVGNVALTLIGSLLFGLGLGAIGRVVLCKRDIL